MSKELKQFYRDLQQWIDAGMPGHNIFDRGTSICLILNWWFFTTYGVKIPRHTYDENTKLFTSQGLHHAYPFNNGLKGWDLELESRSFYKNPERLAFIKEMSK